MVAEARPVYQHLGSLRLTGGSFLQGGVTSWYPDQLTAMSCKDECRWSPPASPTPTHLCPGPTVRDPVLTLYCSLPLSVSHTQVSFTMAPGVKSISLALRTEVQIYALCVLGEIA